MTKIAKIALINDEVNIVLESLDEFSRIAEAHDDDRMQIKIDMIKVKIIKAVDRYERRKIHE